MNVCVYEGIYGGVVGKDIDKPSICKGAQTLPGLGNSYDTFRDEEVANFYVRLPFDRSHMYGTKIPLSPCLQSP